METLAEGNCIPEGKWVLKIDGAFAPRVLRFDGPLARGLWWPLRGSIKGARLAPQVGPTASAGCVEGGDGPTGRGWWYRRFAAMSFIGSVTRSTFVLPVAHDGVPEPPSFGRQKSCRGLLSQALI